MATWALSGVSPLVLQFDGAIVWVSELLYTTSRGRAATAISKYADFEHFSGPTQDSCQDSFLKIAVSARPLEVVYSNSETQTIAQIACRTRDETPDRA